MPFLFIIEAGDVRRVFHVANGSYDEACIKVHSELRRLDPDQWSEDWRDLRADFDDGSQTCYEETVLVQL